MENDFYDLGTEMNYFAKILLYVKFMRHVSSEFGEKIRGFYHVIEINLLLLLVSKRLILFHFCYIDWSILKAAIHIHQCCI